MAEIQHSNIPDEFLHEAKHASNASANTFLRAKGDGTTEFVHLTLGSFQSPILIRDDTNLANAFPMTLTLGNQYVIMLSKTDGDTTSYMNDYIDLRGMNALPTGAGKLISIGGKCEWQNGQLTCKESGWNFYRVVEVI
ncbi:hypothetical protein [Vibrio phage VP41s3]|nr:hypothetical protein [Vibrio phage VP41s3]